MRDDADFNIQFCQLVEKYPELYDYNRSDYSNRCVQDKTWALIAKELNESANDCKERWKNIRGRYSKVYKSRLLPSGSAAKKVKEYYLGPQLQFLNNFLKTRPPRNKVVPEVVYTYEDDNSSADDELNSESSLTSNSATIIEQKYIPIIREPLPLLSTSATSMNKNLTTMKQAQGLAYDYFTAKEQNLNKNDADLCFLKSVLPDMRAMTPQQKRRFKIGVLHLVTQVLEDNDTEASRI